VRVGVHVPGDDPLAAAEERGAEAVQIFLTPPQSWKKPPVRDDEEALCSSPIPVYVHAPYLINVASTQNRIRHPSRQNLQNILEGAARIGAAGVVVHGGHVGDDDDPDLGFGHWRTTLERLETEVPILIENTAGGENAMARQIDRIERLWETIDGVEVPVGLCLDTCHLHAAGEDLVDGAKRLAALPGGISLVHLNDSKDPAGSGRDRHESLGKGQVEVEALVQVVGIAGADVICETPGTAADHRADLDWIRGRLGAS
jgi:deoxyribonuclease-4